MFKKNLFRRLTRTIFTCLFTSFIILSCSSESEGSLKDSAKLNSDIKWWILVHPSYGNSGIYLYNETKSSVEKILPLPEPNGSPHALDFDGKSLWLGGAQSYHNNVDKIISFNPIYELNPENGEILSTIENIRTGGISSTENFLYYSGYGQITQIKKDGEFVESFPVEKGFLSDLAMDNSGMFYVYNGAIDPIMKLNEMSGEIEFLTETEVSNLYTLAIQNNDLVVVATNNYFRRFDKSSGEFLSDKKIEIEGWITAIAPYDKI